MEIIRLACSSTLKDRMASYAAAFREAAGHHGRSIILSGELQDVPLCEIPPGSRCVVLSGVLKVMHLLEPPTIKAEETAGPRDMTIYIAPGLTTISMYEMIVRCGASSIVLSLVPDPPTFAGQSCVYRAVVSCVPTSDDVLESKAEVLILRVDRDSLLSRVPADSLSMRDAACALTEITARVQELCMVALTRYAGQCKAPDVPFDRLALEAAQRRCFVPGVPERHDALFVTSDVADAAVHVLEALLSEEKLMSVEEALRHLYSESGCIVHWDSAYPLNRVPVFLQSPSRAVPDMHLPKVSVLTITRNRPRIFVLAANVFMNLAYPAALLEWVVVDDSDDGMDARGSLGVLRSDDRVKYARISLQDSKPLNVGLKRNVACKMATGDIFVHLDDDDYIPCHSIERRVHALASTGARCAGSTSTLCFDVFTNKTYYSQVKDVFGDPVFFPEPGMMYTRGFWEDRNWDRDASYDEGRRFVAGRDLSDLVDVSPLDNVIMISHCSNMTMDLRRMCGEAPVNRPEALFSESYCRLLKAIYT